ncbi:MAG: hypothetical protein PHU91_04765 [Candidatus Omnitrophica bacterium]|nr:hypothetical protein [Candidatus Omnitrophota bacterium]MDD5611333.1 hypothetical protein [Candidatus Omnitrophota bacterium]
MFKKTSLFFIIFLGLTLIIPFFSFAQTQSEQITLTTYYPSPYGVYKTLRIYPADAAPQTCDSNGQGLMYYSGTYSGGRIETQKMYFCDGTKWQSMAASSVNFGSGTMAVGAQYDTGVNANQYNMVPILRGIESSTIGCQVYIWRNIVNNRHVIGNTAINSSLCYNGTIYYSYIYWPAN